MNYKTYAEAKIANPESEIVTTGRDWSGGGEFIGTFEARLAQSTERTWRHCIGYDSWVICNPADYCSSIKEFLEAGFKLGEGDKFIGINGVVVSVENSNASNIPYCSDANRYILSAAALNGGCKTPAKSEQWTICNNTLPLCELTDEQYGKMRRMHDAGAVVEFASVTNEFKFEAIDKPNWCKDQVYRIKPKSERELFIEATTKVMRDAGTKCPDKHEYFGIMFDAGARYTDLTQYFGENI